MARAARKETDVYLYTGMMTWADGRRYEGNWLEGRCTGHGTTTFKSGSKYVGNYVADKMQGRGCYSFADGRRYEGEYHANQKHGRGVYKWPNGLLFTGTWYRGAPLSGFLLFAGGECAKTTCTASSSSDTCPDLALLRLQEEAQAWIDAREAKSSRMRAPAVGVGASNDGQIFDSNVGKIEKKEKWGRLVGRFGQRSGGERRPLLQDACEFASAGYQGAGGDGCVEVGRQYGGAEGESGGRDGGWQERGGAGKWKFMNVLPMRRSRRQGRGRKARAESSETVGGKDRQAHVRTGTQTGSGGAVNSRDAARAHALLGANAEVGVCVGGYSNDELDQLDDFESEEDDAWQARGDGDPADIPRLEGGAETHVGSDKDAPSAAVSAHSSLSANTTAPAQRPGGGRKLVGKSSRLRRAGADRVTGTDEHSAELGQGDLWFYLIGEPSESSGESGGGSAGGGGAGGRGSGNGKMSNATDEFGRSRLIQVCKCMCNWIFEYTHILTTCSVCLCVSVCLFF